MTLRTTAIILGLATLAGGCTITPRHNEVRVYQHERHVIHEADSYEGYYYVRIVYLNGIPWYVDEDLRARPVPPHLRSHFRYSSWTRSLPPRFSHDTGVRDGYNLSRIVYINEVPHHIDEDRRARSIPQKLRSRFSYGSVAPHNDNGRRPGERSVPPATVHERQEPPNYGAGNALGRVTERMREETRPAPPATGRERQEPPAYGADNTPRQGRPPERMREETGQQVPPFTSNVRTLPRQNEDLPSARGHGQGEQRPLPQGEGRDQDNAQRAVGGRGLSSTGESQRTMPPVSRQAPQPPFQQPHGIDQRDRKQAQSASDDRQRGMGAVNGNERSIDPAPERKKGKGKENIKDQEADAVDERDGEDAKKKRRDE